MGLPDKEDIRSNSNLVNELLFESDTYRDLAITDNVDVYNNLTLKTIAAFDWARRFCPEADFLLKTDDDMFIQIKRLLALTRGLRTSTASPNGIIVGKDAEINVHSLIASTLKITNEDFFSGRDHFADGKSSKVIKA